MSFCTWLLLTHHYQLHTATCSSYHECVACSKYVFLQTKMSFARGCYSLITINFILPRVARITNVLHVLSVCSCKLKLFFASSCYSLITINFILPRVARITTNLHVLSVCSCKPKWVFARGCYSLITINFILPRVAHITNVLHVLSTCSCKLKYFFARGCYPLITINLIYAIVLYVLRKTCRCKKYDPQVTYQNNTHHRSNNIMLP